MYQQDQNHQQDLLDQEYLEYRLDRLDLMDQEYLGYQQGQDYLDNLGYLVGQDNLVYPRSLDYLDNLEYLVNQQDHHHR